VPGSSGPAVVLTSPYADLAVHGRAAPEAVHSSFMESLIPLRGLALHARLTGNQQSREAAERAAEVFVLRHVEGYTNREVGRLLGMLTSLTRGHLAIEVGTLAGYSGIWIARGLHDGGRLISIESKPKHAAFARRQFERAGVGHLIEIRVGPGVEILAKLVEELAPRSVDLLFLDAAKSEYSDYFQIARPLIVPGGLVIADNIYATGRGWIDEGWGTDEFNRLVAADPGFDTVGLPLRQGLLIARRRS